jgi:hypothetical protein
MFCVGRTGAACCRPASELSPDAALLFKPKKTHCEYNPHKCQNCVYANILKRTLDFFLTASVKKNGSSERSGDKPPLHLKDENAPALSCFYSECRDNRDNRDRWDGRDGSIHVCASKRSKRAGNGPALLLEIHHLRVQGMGLRRRKTLRS